MYRSILVPLDGSHFAEHAVPLAAAVARKTEGELRFLRVLPPLSDRYFWAPLPGSDLDIGLHEKYRKEGRAYLESIGRRLTGIHVVYRLLDEHVDIEEAFETEVATDGIDLVVMATHGRSTLDRVWMGSIADKVYRKSAVPVMLMHSHGGAVDFSQVPDIHHILVALDGSARAEQILETVINLGKPAGSNLLLVRAIPSNGGALPVPKTAAPVVPGIDDRVRADAPRYLEAVAAYVRPRVGRVETRVLTAEDPAEAILQQSAGLNLIAMQTRAERGVPRLFHGSVVAKVVEQTTIPVLVDRPHGL